MSFLRLVRYLVPGPSVTERGIMTAAGADATVEKLGAELRRTVARLYG